MPRNRSTDTNGGSFSQEKINKVWRKGSEIQNYDSGVWRYDRCGLPMKYSEYGNTNSKHGWEVDHIKPVALRGSDELPNLQPLQWDNNRKKSDTYPWVCK